MQIATPADALAAALARLALARDRYQLARNEAGRDPTALSRMAERDAWLVLRRAIQGALDIVPVADPDPEDRPS